MFLLGFLLGLSVGLGLWVWQQVKLNLYLQGVIQPFSTAGYEVKLPMTSRIYQQISMVKRQKQNLQQSLKIYQELLDFAPLGYLQVDEESQLLWCNQQAREMLYLQKWQPGQIRLLLELVRSYELDQLIEQTRDLQKSQVLDWIFYPSCENPTTITLLKPLALRGSSLPLPKGQVGVFLENRQSVLDIHQDRDRSFSDLAHELRTPLTSIRLVVETLLNRLDPPLDRWVKRLMQEVDRLISLVQSWLELTQIEAHPAIQLHLEVVELRSLIDSVWETLEPLAQNHNVNIAYSLPENIYIKVDKSRMYQVFVNLLDNSIKYSPPQTTIQISSEVSHSPYLEINIIDSGPGFSSEDLPHIFERFYRGDKARYRSPVMENTSTTTIAGSGLGLAIVRQIIIAHQGMIKAMNHSETGGAWMQIQLPKIVIP